MMKCFGAVARQRNPAEDYLLILLQTSTLVNWKNCIVSNTRLDLNKIILFENCQEMVLNMMQ